MSPVGKTKDAGWEAGVRRTLPVAPERAWGFLLSPAGQELWLGGAAETLERHAAYELADGTRGEVRAASDAHLRLTWAPPDWSGESTVQLRVLPAARGATVSFHHERLADAAERERALARWSAALDRIEAALGD